MNEAIELTNRLVDFPGRELPRQVVVSEFQWHPTEVRVKAHYLTRDLSVVRNLATWIVAVELTVEPFLNGIDAEFPADDERLAKQIRDSD